MVYKLSFFDEKTFWSIFYIRGDPYQKKIKKIIFGDALLFIHHSKALVEFS
jgi:hypothetical protein